MASRIRSSRVGVYFLIFWFVDWVKLWGESLHAHVWLSENRIGFRFSDQSVQEGRLSYTRLSFCCYIFYSCLKKSHKKDWKPSFISNTWFILLLCVKKKVHKPIKIKTVFCQQYHLIILQLCLVCSCPPSWWTCVGHLLFFYTWLTPFFVSFFVSSLQDGLRRLSGNEYVFCKSEF